MATLYRPSRSEPLGRRRRPRRPGRGSAGGGEAVRPRPRGGGRPASASASRRRLGHDPHDRLGARRPQQHPAGAGRARSRPAAISSGEAVGDVGHRATRPPRSSAPGAGGPSTPAVRSASGRPDTARRGRASTTADSRPSPVVAVVGEDDVARLFAAERVAARRRAPRGRSGRPPRSRRRRCPAAAISWRNPRFDMTVTTTVSVGQQAPACRSMAHRAMIWSPSTRSPRVVDGEHPVGVAVEGDARRPLRGPRPRVCSSSGWVDPHRSLMLRRRGPIGDHRDVGAEPAAGSRARASSGSVGAVDDDLEAVEGATLDRADDRVDVGVDDASDRSTIDPIAGARRARRGGRRRGARRSRPRPGAVRHRSACGRPGRRS